ncbi:hypothetical protein TSAR_012511 [Trichomalopsis sarcophagae]|uniref:Uncharacterized protein n=1 Tax=Trichomalopsis sarcophagae TaxID=543379 RepID=A0A232EUJ8_9HYME|nr:hypothetical protein TSAR_012511 [Trichomalopsis sarcophagae]
MDSIPMYDDDNECGDQCFTENTDDLDYEYPPEQETLLELYNYCISPTLYDTFWYLVPLIVASSICNIAARISHIPHKVFHCITASTGIYVVWHYAYECFYLLILFILLFYLYLHLPKDLRRGTKVFIPSLVLILFCEFFMKPKEWNKVRGVIMIAVMKASSVAVDKSELDTPTNFYEYAGYMFCSVTVLFGPWTTFENYVNLYKKTTWKFWWIFVAVGYMLVAFVCLCVSNCWTNWILSDSGGRWMVAFRDALGFRTSHYFICFIASSIMLTGGFPLSQTVITKPLEIEVPRSLVQVMYFVLDASSLGDLEQ